MTKLPSLALLMFHSRSRALAVLVLAIVLPLHSGAIPTLRSSGIPTALPALTTQLSTPSVVEAPWPQTHAGSSSILRRDEVELPKVEEVVVEDIALNVRKRNRARRWFRSLMFNPGERVTLSLKRRKKI